jgi:hypothetical protein
MMNLSFAGRGLAVASLLVAGLLAASCGNRSSGTAQNAQSASPSPATPSSSIPVPPGTPLPDPNANRTLAEQAPLAKGATVRVEARAITLPCYRDNPGMTRENLDQCSRDAAAAGDPICFVGTDGVVYLAEIAAEATADFAVYFGRDVLIDGNIHEISTTLSTQGLTVRRMEMLRIRDKYVTPNVNAAPSNANAAKPAPGGNTPKKP